MANIVDYKNYSRLMEISIRVPDIRAKSKVELEFNQAFTLTVVRVGVKRGMRNGMERGKT